MQYRTINNLAGWLVAAFAFVLYFCSMERTASFWDCGEFLACAYKVEVGHSPGAPFFMLLQRFFALFAGPHTWTGQPSATAAFAINILSVLASALTILFLFWTITRLCRKLIAPLTEPDRGQTFRIIGAGIVGALAYTFSDTFWFSAVEAEVYATSSCFTAMVFWAMLQWEARADSAYADRWLVLIAYLVGVSIGVHLLNLLTIPAIAMIYYFRRYRTTPRGVAAAFTSGCLLLALVQFGIIQYLPIAASAFELFFVNGLGLPFNSGAIAFLALFSALLGTALRYARRKNKVTLHTFMLGFTFVCIGFSSYVVPIIRSSADTPVDVNNPDNVLGLVPYVQREQYVHPPLLYGPDFDTRITGVKEGKKFYYADRSAPDRRYREAGQKARYEYEPGALRFFPRIWDHYDPGHQNFYRAYLGLDKEESPGSGDNLSFFFRYQMNWLWWRYFMWNYAGRQNDYEGQGEARNGNWISGVPFLDYPRTGHINLMSDPYRNNPARNELYCLPLLLGILGMVWHFRTGKKDAFVVLLLFFFTGIAIVLYLNMNPLQPRERDYAFAGCTYAFAIWIGMGMLLLEQGLRRLLPRAGTFLAFIFCLAAVPALMARAEWDDHNRHDKTLARATALNTLLSCAPNAILFTQGDNDTYPLWYLQEVEGVRPDVRVVITELLNADWYIDQLNYKINDAGPVPMAWSREDYMGEAGNYTSYYRNSNVPEDRYFDLYDVCSFISDKRNRLPAGNGKQAAYLPTRNFYLQLPAGMQTDTTLMPDSSNRIYFSLKSDGVQKKELAVMNILAANARSGWKRPVYFNGSYPYRDDMLHLGAYLRMEGIVYRLAPFTAMDYNAAARQVNNIDVGKSLDNFLRRYQYGGAEKEHVYFDEKNRVMLMSYRINSVELAERLTALGRKQEAVSLLDTMLQRITPASYPHDEVSLFMAEAYYHAGAIGKGAKLARLLADNARQDIAWIQDMNEAGREAAQQDLVRDATLIRRLAGTAASAGDGQTAAYLQQGLAELPQMQLHAPAP